MSTRLHLFARRTLLSGHFTPSTNHCTRLNSAQLYRAMTTQAQLDRLGSFSTCEISDALLKLKVSSGGYVPDLEIFSPVKEGGSVVGEAYTVKMVDQKDVDAPKPDGHYVDLAPRNSVMVISSPPHVKSASLGGLLALGAAVRGVKAVVIDGRCRDLAELRSVGLPVFARSHSTLGQSPFTRPSELQVPITISARDSPDWPSVTVNPSDLVLADADGVIVVPHELLAVVLEAATEGKEVDEKCRVAIEGGMGVKEAFNKYRGNTKKH